MNRVVSAGSGIVDGFAIDAGDGGDVFGGFEAAFDLEGDDPGFDEIRDKIDGGEVLWGEEVAVLAEITGFPIDNDLVGHAAGLGAFAAVGGALAEAFRGEALAGVGDAEGAVDEDFEGSGKCRVRSEKCGLKSFDFFDGEFAGEDGALHGEDGF